MKRKTTTAMMFLLVIAFFALASLTSRDDGKTCQVAYHKVSDAPGENFDQLTYTIAPDQGYDDVKDVLVQSYMNYIAGKDWQGLKNASPSGATGVPRWQYYVVESATVDHYTVLHTAPGCPNNIHGVFVSMRLHLKKLYSACQRTARTDDEGVAIRQVTKELEREGVSIDSV